MGQQAVLIEDGIEIDWIDPVINVEEDRHQWIIDNGSFKYHLNKGKGRELLIRERQ